MFAITRAWALVAVVLMTGWGGNRSLSSSQDRAVVVGRAAVDSASRFDAASATGPRVSGQRISTVPPRTAVGLSVLRNGWVYDCMECHTLLAGRWHYDRPLNEHQAVSLEHGNNRFCLNCHHPSNRNAYVDYDGAAIAQADVVQLCGKCHGTILRDWQAGVHGRQSGSWSARAGGRTSLRCIECHDPHQPAFASMRPLPPLRYPARAAHPPPNRRATSPATP